MKNSTKTNLKSRRDFLGTSAKVMGTGALLSSLPISVSAYAGAAGEVKVALVGCGGRGTGAASQAIEADPDVRLVAMADVFGDRLEKCFKSLSTKYDGKGKVQVNDASKFTDFDGYKKAIDMADVVILTTPPGFRPLHFEYAVAQGKHVFMEKPLATDVDGIKRILEAGKEAKRKKLNVVVGLQRHYQKNYREVEKLVKNGSLGDIVSGQVYWNGGGVWTRPRQPAQTELEYQMLNWYYFTWICGDHILEQHIHNIDVANWYIGSAPVSAQGMGGRETRIGKDSGHIFDHHFVEFVYPEGQVISSQCRHQRNCMNRVEEVFQATNGNILVNGGNRAIVTSRNGSSILDYKGDGDVNPYQQEHNELFAAIKAGDYKYDNVQYGAESTMTAILGRMATYSGQMITWDEAMATNLKLVPDNLTSFKDQAPILPDANGNYEVAIPGKTKFI